MKFCFCLCNDMVRIVILSALPQFCNEVMNDRFGPNSD